MVARAVALLPETIQPEDRTMLFKELELAGYRITWFSRSGKYVIKDDTTWTEYLYDFKHSLYRRGGLHFHSLPGSE